MKSIFHQSFHYTKSFETDIKKTFDRIRREQRKCAAAKPPEKEASGKVLAIKQRK